MRFDILSIFPEFFAGPLDYGIVRRAREARLIDARIHDLRAFTHDRHHSVDDRPFGGGEGMVMKPEPLFDAVETLVKRGHEAGGATAPADMAIVLLSASGKLFQQETARRFAKQRRAASRCIDLHSSLGFCMRTHPANIGMCFLLESGLCRPSNAWTPHWGTTLYACGQAISCAEPTTRLYYWI